MKQIKLRTVNGLIDAGGKASGGANQHGATLQLVFGSKANIDGDVAALILARDNHEGGKTELRTRRTTLKSSTATGKDFAKAARKLLERTLGSHYTAAWDAAGFRGSLKVPATPGAVKEVVRSLKAYFTANATAAVEQLDLTADRANTIVQTIEAAQVAVNVQVTAVKTLLELRKDKEAAMASRLSGLVEELGRKIEPLDPRWMAFGLKMPGSKQIADVPQNIIAALIGPGVVAVKWDASARAEHYRVWKKVVGVDENPVAVGSPLDLDFAIEGLPANSTIEITVSAVNNGGESGKSIVVTVHTA